MERDFKTFLDHYFPEGQSSLFNDFGRKHGLPNEADIFKPIHLGDAPKKMLIPNSDTPATIDAFLSQLNLPATWENEDCFLALGVEHYKELLELRKKATVFNGRFTRYRGFLLLFNDEIPKGFLYVGLIFDKIQELEFAIANGDSSLKTRQMLDYLRTNRFKKD
jgi:hypothetical protein